IGRQIGQYRIEELIGIGGMGRIYRAWDEKLGRPVAVKVLRDFKSGDDLSRRRFLREAELASRVVHPYVATVFDVVTENGDIYLVMEYVDGRPLHKVIERRRLTPGEAAYYGREIAEALGAIHEAGLVHRDLKPANIMLTNDDHVKVMDLGLARQFVPEDWGSDGDATLTREGFTVGTPLYMSPEQLRGKEVDQRSDLFALGIVLYESLTGEHPFLRDSYGEITSAIMNEDPGGGSEPRSLADAGKFRDVIMRLLEKLPADRFATAEEVVSNLPSPSREIEPRVKVSPTRRRRWLTMALVGLLPLVVALVIFQIIRQEATLPASITPRALVAVLPLQDHTTDPDSVIRGEMLASLLAADLSESTIVRSMGHDKVLEILAGLPRGAPRSAQIAAIRRAIDVDWVVTGEIFREGDGYEAAMDLYGIDPSTPHDSFRVGAARATGVVNVASAEVRRSIDPAAGDEVKTTASDELLLSDHEEALLLEYKGRRAQREHRFGDAIDFYERALAIDPQFAFAQIELAVVLDRAGYGTRAQEAANKALRIVEGPAGAPGSRLALVVRALHAELHNDFETEKVLRRELAERYPDEPQTLYSLSWALLNANEHDEALAFAEQSLAIFDRNPWQYDLKARILLELGDFEGAFEALDRAEALFEAINSDPGLARVAEERAMVEWRRGQYGRAARLYEQAAGGYESAGLDVNAARTRCNYATMCLMGGRIETARTLYDAALPVLRRAGALESIAHALSGLGAGYLQEGALTDSEVMLREAVALGRELGNDSVLLPPLFNLGSMLVTAGRIAEGARLAEEALGVARNLKDRQAEIGLLGILADVDYQRGRFDDAEQAFRDLIEIASLPEGNHDSHVQALTSLAWLLQARGELEEAASTADRAVALSRDRGDLVTRSWALGARAGLREELSDREGAQSDMAMAVTVARKTGVELRELDAYLDLVRAELAGLDDDWVAARELSDAARNAAIESGDPSAVADALVLSSIFALESGATKEAAHLARQAIEADGAMATTRIRGSLALARALRALGELEESADLAEEVLHRADAMRLSLPTAMAAAELVALPVPHRPDNILPIRERGQEALARYLDSVPKENREAVSARREIRRVSTALSEDV
ncbi:MAG: tetratricopeptide repeat protein, partial [Acidobacteriota bacterium]|nr:tetratricopeptide repeat protein [Acidobacteriota bacterium]